MKNVREYAWGSILMSLVAAGSIAAVYTIAMLLMPFFAEAIKVGLSTAIIAFAGLTWACTRENEQPFIVGGAIGAMMIALIDMIDNPQNWFVVLVVFGGFLVWYFEPVAVDVITMFKPEEDPDIRPYLPPLDPPATKFDGEWVGADLEA